MTQRQRKQLLWLANGTLAAAVLLAAAAAFLPLSRPAPLPASVHPQAVAATTADRRIAPPEDLAVIHQRDLRQSLFPSDAPPPDMPAPPALNLALTGTAVENKFSFAMFRTPNGEDKMVEVGQSINGAEVVAITTRSATVRYNGQLIVLTVEKEGSQPQERQP